jgi:diaminopimelate dehydrogenase
VGAGWDPGLLSAMRVYLTAFGLRTQTFWGKGVSLGHSNAIKQIDGVEDAIQFTVPNTNAVTLSQRGQYVEEYEKHKRLCYVVAPKSKHRQIEQIIRKMPSYFAGYETEITFVSKTEFNKRFNGKTAHAGLVIAHNMLARAEFKLKLKSNAYFTASVMLAYALANKSMQDDKMAGVFTVAEIAPKYLLDECLSLI